MDFIEIVHNYPGMVVNIDIIHHPGGNVLSQLVSWLSGEEVLLVKEHLTLKIHTMDFVGGKIHGTVKQTGRRVRNATISLPPLGEKSSTTIKVGGETYYVAVADLRYRNSKEQYKVAIISCL